MGHRHRGESGHSVGRSGERADTGQQLAAGQVCFVLGHIVSFVLLSFIFRGADGTCRAKHHAIVDNDDGQPVTKVWNATV